MTGDFFILKIWKAHNASELILLLDGEEVPWGKVELEVKLSLGDIFGDTVVFSSSCEA